MVLSFGVLSKCFDQPPCRFFRHALNGRREITANDGRRIDFREPDKLSEQICRNFFVVRAKLNAPPAYELIRVKQSASGHVIGKVSQGIYGPKRAEADGGIEMIGKKAAHDGNHL